MKPTVPELLGKLPQIGKVVWIGVRPERRAPMIDVQEVEARTDFGLTGDRYAGRSGNRQVTLIQAEHLPVMASLSDVPNVTPDMLRRNIVVEGINLLALKDKEFQIGNVRLQYTGLCHPCSYMEEVLGEGGYNAMRGHGGITARVLESGVIRVEDQVQFLV